MMARNCRKVLLLINFSGVRYNIFDVAFHESETYYTTYARIQGGNFNATFGSIMILI